MATNRQMIAELRKRIEAAGSQEALAKEWGYTRQYMSRLVNGKDALSDEVIRLLGYEKLPDRYRKISAIDARKESA